MKGEPVPKGYMVWNNHLETSLARMPPDDRDAVKREIIPVLLKCPVKVIGPDVFAYRYGQIDNDTKSFVIMLNFYARHLFLGIVRRGMPA